MARRVFYRRPFLYPAQASAIFCEERWGIVEASTKSGKTVGCICWLHERAALHGGGGRNFWWVAPIYPQARIAFRRLKRALPRKSFTSNERDSTITLANGSVLWFKGAEIPDNLYGEDVYDAVIDEATRVKEEAWHAVRTTLTATGGSARIIGNVKGVANWAYRLARRAEEGGGAYHYARLTVVDAVDAGIFPSAEMEDAKASLPDAVFRELYLAEAAVGERFFDTTRIGVVQAAPADARHLRAWDFAVTEPRPGRDPDWTVGVRLAMTDSRVYVVDVVRLRAGPEEVLRVFRDTVTADGPSCNQAVEEELGGAGKMLVAALRSEIGRITTPVGRLSSAMITGDKQTRATPFGAWVNDGRVDVVYGPWTDSFLLELDYFGMGGIHDDQVDAAAHAFNVLAPTSYRVGSVRVPGG